jgi:hypothetical protein
MSRKRWASAGLNWWSKKRYAMRARQVLQLPLLELIARLIESVLQHFDGRQSLAGHRTDLRRPLRDRLQVRLDERDELLLSLDHLRQDAAVTATRAVRLPARCPHQSK